MPIDLHVFSAGLDVIEQLVDGGGEVDLLFKQDVQLELATLAVVVGGIGALGLLAHVIDFQGKDAQAVDGPCRALGVDGGIGQRLHVAELLSEVGVNLLDEVGAVLIRAVDAAFQLQGLDGVDVRVADDVLEVPLHGVDPALQVEPVLDGVLRVGIIDGCVDIVLDVIVADDLPEDIVALFGKCHFCEIVFNER